MLSKPSEISGQTSNSEKNAPSDCLIVWIRMGCYNIARKTKGDENIQKILLLTWRLY
jgi:hypothetical protein